MYGVVSLLAALNYRYETGKGQYIDIAQNEAVTTLIPEVIMEQVMNGRTGPASAIVMKSWLRTAVILARRRQMVAIAVGNDEEWDAMCKVMGNPEWCKDEKFSDQFSRWQNQDELNKLVASWTKDFTDHEVMHKLQKAGIAAGSSLDIGELIIDPQVVKRGAIIQQNHPVAGKINVYRAPWKSALTAKNPPAPLLGEHNDYVLRHCSVCQTAK